MNLKSIGFLLAGLFIGVSLGLSILSGSAVTAGRQSGLTGRAPATGSIAPDFELISLEGSKTRFSRYKGTAVVLNFWASWCVPCREEMPLLQKISELYSDDLTVVGVNVMEDRPVVSSFTGEYGITFPVLLDERGFVDRLYVVRGLPTTYFIDAKGFLQSQFIGALSEDTLSDHLKLLGIGE